MAIATRTLRQFIGGRFVPPAGGRTLDDVAPATSEIVARVPRGDAADVDAAVAAARGAFAAWSATPVAVRADLLEAIASRLAAELEPLRGPRSS